MAKKKPPKPAPKPKAEKLLIRSDQVVDLLRLKHSDDICFTEVRNGPSMSVGRGEMRKIDFWAMLPTWSPPTAIAYEIKVDRGDFMRDNKWMEYLNYCNQFYFVCPSHVIRPDEIPAEVGLIWLSQTGSTLLTKRKALHRKVEIPEKFWRHVLMSNCKYRVRPQTAQDWHDHFHNEASDYRLGRANSKKIHELVYGKFMELDRQKITQEAMDKKWEGVKKALEDLGLRTDFYNLPSKWEIKSKLEELNRILPGDLEERLSRLQNVLEITIESIKKAYELRDGKPAENNSSEEDED